jgi:MFS family permease
VSHPDRADDRPATFGQVWANGEYRAIYSASALSWFGDSVARAAVTALVYRSTGSVVLSAATFAISYLPWLGIGPVLTALAERYPLRRVMVVCDVVRMVTMGLVALPNMPLPAILSLLFATALLNPPFDAARSALLPRVLTGNRYVLAISIQLTTAQIALITGYFAGGALAPFRPHLTLMLNAATFGLSACLIGFGVRNRPAAVRKEQRKPLLRETAAGFGLVFGQPLLRSIALLVFGTMLFVVVPEGLAAGWAGELAGKAWHNQGWMQGLIMMSNPIGWVCGGLLINRLVRPSLRQRLIRPFALLAPFALMWAVFRPPVYLVALISAVTGFASGGFMPAANALFVQSLPATFRARAFGVMSSGVQLLQGAAVLTTGALAQRFDVPWVVGLWGIGGLGLMLLMSSLWPSPHRIRESVDTVTRANAEADLASVQNDETIVIPSLVPNDDTVVLPALGNGRHAAGGVRPSRHAARSMR